MLPFVAGKEAAGGVTFDGVLYQSVDVEFTGMMTNGQGALPTPHIKLANTQGTWQSLVNTYGDLLGCTLTRIRTYSRFLDGGSAPDPTAFYGPDVFRIERKVAINPVFVEWELSAAIDQEGVKLPRRIVVRDTCMFRYRAWNPGTSSFDYSKAVCPYTGTSYFDASDSPVVDPSNDVPSRRKGCCKARFGASNPLPFGGYPGVSRGR